MPFYYWIPVWLFSTMFSIGVSASNAENPKMYFKENCAGFIIHQIIIFAVIISVEIYIFK